MIYEWKPIVCSNCKKIGHAVEECRVKKRAEMVWRPKQDKVDGEIVLIKTPMAHRRVDKDGFILVSRRRATGAGKNGSD